MVVKCCGRFANAGNPSSRPTQSASAEFIFLVRKEREGRKKSLEIRL